MSITAHLVKRGALMLAVLALMTAAAALTPRRADAQVPFGGCFLRPVTVVQPVSTLTGFTVFRPVTLLREVCPSSFIATPSCTVFACIASAISNVVPIVRPVFFRVCPSSLGCFFPVHVVRHGHRF